MTIATAKDCAACVGISPCGAPISKKQAVYERGQPRSLRSSGPKFDQFYGNRCLAESPDVAAYVDSDVAGFLGSRTNGVIAHYVIYGQHEQRLAFSLGE
jgi:hypothetical protein